MKVARGAAEEPTFLSPYPFPSSLCVSLPSALCPLPFPLRSDYLPIQYLREDERCDDRCVAFDDVVGRVDAQLAPRDLLVGHGARVRAVARRRVADLAEVAPQRHAFAAQVLMQHRDDADREVAGDAAADLEEADRRLRRRL